MYSFISRKKSLKVVDNTPTIGFRRSLNFQNSHADISPLILMTGLIDIYALLPENDSFLSVSKGPTSMLSDIVITLRKSYEIVFVRYS